MRKHETKYGKSNLECIFPENDPEHTAAIDLVYGREYCIDMFDNCLKNMIEEYKSTISGYEVSRKRFNKAEEEAGNNCDPICFYHIIYQKLYYDRVFCV
ncbi:hypothetical protein FF38_13536 [Lucilia cuprina]|uniref:Uncharacterized protein n=1 Tax=Lucilia cuprina TaxID=7375 RepID=A0A0L0BPV5_LUCCU|nr:hypothetical protein FF38_13536 [Lucilia cuprina]